MCVCGSSQTQVQGEALVKRIKSLNFEPNQGNPRRTRAVHGSGSSPGEEIGYPLQYSWASLVTQMVHNPPAMCLIFLAFVAVAQSLSYVRLFVTPWTAACQASLSLGYSRQEYCSGLPFPLSGELPDPGIEPKSSVPALAGGFFTTEPPGKPILDYLKYLILCK